MGSNPTLSAMKIIPALPKEDLYMKKEFEVACEVNMSTNHIKAVRVTTNLPAKAIKLAKEKLKKRGYFDVQVISCKEI